MLRPNEWQAVSGTNAVEIYAFINKPSVTNSNCYLFRSPTTILVVDPGADPLQLHSINEVVAGLLAEQPRQVIVLATHYHVDHVTSIPDLLPGVRKLVAAHGIVAQLLAEGDLSWTQTHFIKNPEFRCHQPDILFFSNNPHGDAWRHEHLSLGGADTIDIYETPGHSPCSVTFRIGDLLIIGDLPFAATPGLVGICGWNQRALMHSLAHVQDLLEREPIAWCLAGHGYPLSNAAARAMFDQAASLACSLGDVAALDTDRMRDIRHYATDLLDEARHLFTIIAGKIYAVSFHLSNLEEMDEAQKVLALLDMDAIDTIIADFEAFHCAFEAGQQLEMSLAIKAAGLALRLDEVFRKCRLGTILPLSLHRRATRLLEDFINTVKGLTFLDAPEPIDASAFVGGLVRKLVSLHHNNDGVLEAACDPAAFVRLLVSRLAMQSPLQTATIMTDLPPDPALALIDRDRLEDVLTGALEKLSCAEGCGEIWVTVRTVDDMVSVTANGAATSDAIRDHDLRLWHRSLSRRGAMVTGGANSVIVTMPQAQRFG